MAKKLYVGGKRPRGGRITKKQVIIALLALCALYLIRGPYIAKGHSAAGDEYLNEGKLSEALYEYRRAKVAQPYKKEINSKIGEVYARNLDCVNSEKYFKKSNDLNGMAETADCYRIMGQPDKAGELLSGDAKEFIPAKIRLLLSKGEFGTAFKLASDYHEESKNKASFDLLLIGLAVQDFDKAATLYKNGEYKTNLGNEITRHAKIRSKDTKNLQLANILMDNSLSDVAVKIAEKVVKKQKNYRDAYFVFARALFLSGSTERAIQQAERGIELDPIHPNGYVFLAELYEKYGNNEKAKEMREKSDLYDLSG